MNNSRLLKKISSNVNMGIALILIGLIILIWGLIGEWNADMHEFDDHLSEVIDSADKDLEHEFYIFESMLDSFVKSPELAQAEDKWHKNRDVEMLLWLMNESLFFDYPEIAGIAAISDERVIACRMRDEDVTLKIYKHTEAGLSLCEGSNDHIYLGIFDDRGREGIRYVVLLSPEILYTIISGEEKEDSCIIVLYDSAHALLVSNLSPESYYIRVSDEKNRYLNRICDIMAETKDRRIQKTQTIRIDKKICRFVSRPETVSKNGYFAMGVLLNAGNFLQSMWQALLAISVGLAMICAGGFYSVYISWLELEQAKRNISYLKLEQETARLREELLLARMKNTQSQMQPHFLYNALGSIREIVLDDPEYASDLIYDFTRHLRACIRYLSNDDLIPFSKELENIKAYVNIEIMRFGDKLQVNYEIMETDFYVVPLSIQPLVENAIRHGIFNRGKAGGQVIVRSFFEDGLCVIQIEDNGVGFDPEQVKREIEQNGRDSTGLFNNKFRIETLMRGHVIIESTIGKGTLIEVIIPYREVEDESGYRG